MECGKFDGRREGGHWREKGLERVDEREEMKQERLQVQGERRRASERGKMRST